jgi:uncharacterized protein YuzE
MKIQVALIIVFSVITLTGCETASQSTNIAATQSNKKVDVTTFFDGNEGFSLSIPTGNESKCTWTYSAGTADVPYIEVTSAKTAYEKHTLTIEGGIDIINEKKVICVDDFGEQYEGVFKK